MDPPRFSGIPTISVVIPAYNQGDHIGSIVTAYLEVLGRMPTVTELIVVPNACRDETVPVLRRIMVGEPRLKVVELEEGGWGRAVRAGLDVATGELLCFTNSARTQPEMLALMLLYASAYPEVVVKANRKIRESLRRRFGSLLYNLECRALFDLPTWDVNGTPKVFPRTFGELLRLRSDGDMLDAEFIATCAEHRYPIVEVPVLATQRHGGKSTTNYGSALRMYVGAIELQRRLRP